MSYPSASSSARENAAIRILIADDLEEWRTRIRKILNSRREWEVIFEACDGQQALDKAVELSPDIVLLDIGMPVMNGIQAGSRIRQRCRDAHIIFVTQTPDDVVMEAVMELGASGYVLKTDIATKLVGVIAAAVGSIC